MREIIDDITNFILVADEPHKADLIIAMGGSYPQIPEMAAKLYNAGLAPYIVAAGMFSCKLGRFRVLRDKCDIYDKHRTTEYDFYYDALMRNGVPEAAIIREDKSEYTRHNIRTCGNRNDWFKSEKGIRRILGEVKRYGEQVDVTDIMCFTEKQGG
ncbi:MAG: YdcF family protein [Oscillospiraceae bacterium]|nr:YdcF family protein [Oscillospiraceae bacterium]